MYTTFRHSVYVISGIQAQIQDYTCLGTHFTHTCIGYCVCLNTHRVNNIMIIINFGLFVQCHNVEIYFSRNQKIQRNTRARVLARRTFRILSTQSSITDKGYQRKTIPPSSARVARFLLTSVYIYTHVPTAYIPGVTVCDSRESYTVTLMVIGVYELYTALLSGRVGSDIKPLHFRLAAKAWLSCTIIMIHRAWYNCIRRIGITCIICVKRLEFQK